MEKTIILQVTGKTQVRALELPWVGLIRVFILQYAMYVGVKFFYIKDKNNVMLLFLVDTGMLTSSRVLCSSLAFASACTTSQLHLLSSMSVPTLPVTFGSP